MLFKEQKILEWIESKIQIIAFIAITVLAIFIRFSLKDHISEDYTLFLSDWYVKVKENGLKTPVGDYNLLYHFMIMLMTYLPVKALYAYKIMSCVFDFALAVAVGYIAHQLSYDNHKQNAFLAYSAVLLSPCVFLNSAAWAQCDAMYTFFIAVTFIALLKDKYSLTFILYGVAMAFKLQAIFFLPFLAFYYFVKKNFSVLHFLWVPFSMIIVNIPCLLAGRGILEIFEIYFKQTDTYKSVHMNYPSFWTIFHSSRDSGNYETFKGMAIGFTITVLGILIFQLITQKVNVDNKLLLYTAFLTNYACVLFLPAMHERYSFCYEIFAILLIFINKKTIPLLLSLLYLSASTYGYYLYQTQINIRILGTLNTITFLLYCYIMWKDIAPTDSKRSLR